MATRTPHDTLSSSSTKPPQSQQYNQQAQQRSIPSDDSRYNPLSAEFDAALALAHPHLVKLPLKKYPPGLLSLSQVSHLLPYNDVNYKEQNTMRSGATKHKMELLIHTITSAAGTTTATTGSQSSIGAGLGSIGQKPNSNDQHAGIRFTTKVKVSKMPLKSNPVLAFKPGSNRLFNAVIKRQLIGIVSRAERNLTYQKSRLKIGLPPPPPQGNDSTNSFLSMNVEYNNNDEDAAWGLGVNQSSDGYATSSTSTTYSINNHQPPTSLQFNPTQRIITIIGATGTPGDRWIRYFLLPPPLAQQQDSNNQSTIPTIIHPPQQQQQQHTLPLPSTDSQFYLQQHPLRYDGVELKYPHLTPKQVLFMIFQTHYLRKCKVHQTKRKRLTYPCTCLIQPSPFPLPVLVNGRYLNENNKQAHNGGANPNQNTNRTTHITADNTQGQQKQPQQPLTLHPKFIKAQFKQAHHTPGPLSCLQSFLFSESKRHVRVNLISTMPGAPFPIPVEVLDRDGHDDGNGTERNSLPASFHLKHSREINQLLSSLPSIPQYVIDILAQDLIGEGQYNAPGDILNGDHSRDHTHSTLQQSKVFYNRSGNPRLNSSTSLARAEPMTSMETPTVPQSQPTPTASTSPHPISLLQGRMRTGIASIIIGKLVFFDRKGNIGLNDMIEYKWVWVPIIPSSTAHNNNNNRNNTRHGVWVILPRQLPRSIITASTVATVALEPQQRFSNPTDCAKLSL